MIETIEGIEKVSCVRTSDSRIECKLFDSEDPDLAFGVIPIDQEEKSVNHLRTDNNFWEPDRMDGRKVFYPKDGEVRFQKSPDETVQKLWVKGRDREVIDFEESQGESMFASID